MATPWLSDLALAAGAVGVAGAMSFTTKDGVTPANVIFGAILLAIFFVGVRSAVRAAQRAAAQRRVADQRASASPTEAVVPAVRTEAERLYADVRSTLHVALEAIANAASRAPVISPGQSSASDTVAIEALRAIQRHARIATTELHRMSWPITESEARRAFGADSVSLVCVNGPSSSAVVCAQNQPPRAFALRRSCRSLGRW